MAVSPIASWRAFLLAAALEAGAAFVVLARIPSEAGVSLFRLTLLGGLLACTGLSLYLAWRPHPLPDRQPGPAWTWIAALAAVGLSLTLFLLRYSDPAQLMPVYARLAPLLWFLLAFSLQLCILLLYLRHGVRPRALAALRPTVRAAVAGFVVLLLLFLLVTLTRLGLTPDPAYWGEPGVPLLGWQFGLALLGGLFTFCLLLSWRTPRHAHVVLPLALWLTAVLVWLSVPMEVLKNSFYVALDPPAFEPFPYSDAGYYDSMAHSLLIGHPYQGQIPTRPLYIVFLAALHALLGENYALIIAVQTMVLALIPVMLYQLAARLHSPAAGVTVALFSIFRELTTLLVSSETRVSHTRTLLVDLPTLLCVCVACLLALRWLERRDRRSAFLAGGAFGVLLLLRTQSLLIAPFLFGVVVLTYGLKDRRWLSAALIFVLALALTVAPWLTHNYLEIGQFSFDAPFQYRVIASQYAYSGNLDIQNYDFEGKSLARVLLDFTLNDPGFVFGFIANHYLAGLAGAVLALPLIQPFPGIFEPIDLYWLHWDGSPAWYNAALLVGYLAVIALGLAAAWRRWRWIGLLPLAFSLGYALATAIGRFSGWRYDLPADWVAYFYFGIGFVECLWGPAVLFGADYPDRDPARESAPVRETRIRDLVRPALLFLSIGALPWLAELPTAPRYVPAEPSVLAARLADSSGAPALEQVQAFLAQPGAVITEGRLLYPRFFYRGTGLASANAWPAYAVRDYPRTGFVLLNESLVDVLFPDREPQAFKQAADAVVLGCRREDYVEARVVAFPAQDQAHVAEDFRRPCADP